MVGGGGGGVRGATEGGRGRDSGLCTREREWVRWPASADGAPKMHNAPHSLPDSNIDPREWECTAPG